MVAEPQTTPGAGGIRLQLGLPADGHGQLRLGAPEVQGGQDRRSCQRGPGSDFLQILAGDAAQGLLPAEYQATVAFQARLEQGGEVPGKGHGIGTGVVFQHEDGIGQRGHLCCSLQEVQTASVPADGAFGTLPCGQGPPPFPQGLRLSWSENLASSVQSGEGVTSTR